MSARVPTEAPAELGRGNGAGAATLPSRRRRVFVGGFLVAVAVAGLAVWALVGRGSDSGGDTSAAAPATATAVVDRRDLVERESFSGTLAYANSRMVVSQLTGTVTRLAAEGATLKRGQVLYRVDEHPVVLMYGTVPAYRRLDASVSDGRDVRQLEWNLVALGYDPQRDVTIDGEWTSATTAAVERWQEDVGVTVDGGVELGEVVFLLGAQRVGGHEVTVGTAAQPGLAVLTTASTAQVVTLDLAADRQDLVAVGDQVEVELPGGETVAGTITEVGAVAEAPVAADGTESEPTIEVTIGLAGRPAVALDQAPVDVDVETSRREDVVAVPVAALVALAGGGYAVEVPDGASTRLVAVETGASADGYVEVRAGELEPGMQVVVPA
ncbi:MAG TPA: peptidoglycan-binding domain-containing protein [Gaiellaceae bacterium]|nr:peptidoglycan-binding domain-containing protein [Gaiellaceae bacterium]